MTKRVSKVFLWASFLLLCTVKPAQASSGWSWGVGYHNPPNATLGLNFMHLWTNWAFEVGLGYINSTESNSSNTKANSSSNNVNLAVGGDLNFKYLFSSGTFRPYLQGGTYLGLAAQSGDNSGAGASVGGGFGGAGFFIMTNSVDFYISYITAGNGSLQFGINF